MEDVLLHLPDASFARADLYLTSYFSTKMSPIMVNEHSSCRKLQFPFYPYLLSFSLPLFNSLSLIKVHVEVLLSCLCASEILWIKNRT